MTVYELLMALGEVGDIDIATTEVVFVTPARTIHQVGAVNLRQRDALEPPYVELTQK